MLSETSAQSINTLPQEITVNRA